jgi:acyl-coenzyme A thioesterase PaaI-like protein
VSEIRADLFHAGGSAHGFSYFRLLDDAAYFAAQSMEMEYFLNTAQFSLKFLRPLRAGAVACRATAEARGRVYEAKAELFQNEELCALGEGVFLRSRTLLAEVVSFRP